MILYRPVGLNELELIARGGFREFPPRLPEQPIFYPVLLLEYARQIARDWNTKEPEQVGFVTRFDVDDEFAARYPIQIVGSSAHEELWVPAEELGEFNAHIKPPIEVIESYKGRGFQGEIDPTTNLPTGLVRT